MNNTEKLILDLVSRPSEESWFEFKENWYEPRGIGEYIASLSNAAVLAGHPYGYLIWGVRDTDHEIVGSSFAWKKDVRNEPLEHWLARQISPDLGFRFSDHVI